MFQQVGKTVPSRLFSVGSYMILDLYGRNGIGMIRVQDHVLPVYNYFLQWHMHAEEI
jgi:hypothetical protein